MIITYHLIIQEHQRDENNIKHLSKDLTLISSVPISLANKMKKLF